MDNKFPREIYTLESQLLSLMQQYLALASHFGHVNGENPEALRELVTYAADVHRMEQITSQAQDRLGALISAGEYDVARHLDRNPPFHSWSQKAEEERTEEILSQFLCQVHMASGTAHVLVNVLEAQLRHSANPEKSADAEAVYAKIFRDLAFLRDMTLQAQSRMIELQRQHNHQLFRSMFL